MIIKNKQKSILITMAMSLSMSCATSFADDITEADTAITISEAHEADVSGDTTINGRDAPSFEDVLESNYIFDDISLGIKSNLLY